MEPGGQNTGDRSAKHIACSSSKVDSRKAHLCLLAAQLTLSGSSQSTQKEQVEERGHAAEADLRYMKSNAQVNGEQLAGKEE